MTAVNRYGTCALLQGPAALEAPGLQESLEPIKTKLLKLLLA